jgi:hypothetical protein
MRLTFLFEIRCRAAGLMREARLSVARMIAGPAIDEMVAALAVSHDAMEAVKSAIAERDDVIRRFIDETKKMTLIMSRNAAALGDFASQQRRLNLLMDDIAEAIISTSQSLDCSLVPPRPAAPFRPSVIAGKDHDNAAT